MSRVLGGIVYLFCILFSGVSPCAAQQTAIESATASPVMEVRYFDRGIKDARHAYKYQLIRELLEATRAEYGDYRVVPFGAESSAKRQSLLMSEGRALNLTWASPGTVIASADVIAIPVDILKGLLGYRICLINPANFPSAIHKLGDMVIGQGLNWSDVDIYRFNNIPVREAPSFEALFDMLAVKRYQCLSLGADEVLFTWREKNADYPFLTVEPQLLIYYDYPIYLQVSKKTPELARRLELGLAKLIQSGRFDVLFDQYHAADLKLLALHQRRYFCLLSPYLPLPGQCTKSPVLLQHQP